MDTHTTNIHGGIGGGGGAGGEYGGAGGVGQGPTVYINADNVNFPSAPSEDYYLLMDFVSSLNFLPQQQEIYETWQKGTGGWFLEHPDFLDWVSGPTKLLWCAGIPGSGKTVLASVVVNYLKKLDKPNVGVACAYLNYKESRTQSTHQILGAIWRQLASEVNLQSARILYQKHSRQNTRISFEEIQDLLKDVIQQFSSVFIILDALDEYSSDDQEFLLTELLGIGANSKLLVTTRPHLAPPEDVQAIQLHIHPPDDDIQSYIMSQITRSRRLKRFAHNEDLKSMILQSVTRTADGMFLLAKLQMDLLSSALTQDAVFKALETLPTNLDALYARTLEQIRNEKPELREIGLLALAWVAFTKRPLKEEELLAALAIPSSKPVMPDETSMVQVDDLLEACHGLLVLGTTNRSFRLVHYSTQEFMEAIQDLEFPEVHVTISRTLLICAQFAMDSEDFPDSQYFATPNLSYHLMLGHPLLAYSQYIFHHTSKETERTLGSELLAGLKYLKPYPGWRIEPWIYQPWPEKPTTLWLAVAGKLLSTTQYLLEDQAQAQQASRTIVIAAHYGYLEMLETLQTANIQVKQKDLNLALQKAAEAGHEKVVEYLLVWGSYVDSTSQYSDESPLHMAAEGGHYRIVQLLLQAGADINGIGGWFGTALQSAAAQGHSDVVQLLLKSGADPNIVEGLYGTALQAAACGGYKTIIELLLDEKADPDIVGGKHGTPLQAAAHCGHIEIVRLLFHEAQADLNIAGGEDGSTLQAAASYGHTDIVELLLEANIDPNIVNAGRNYGTALQASAHRGHEEIVRLLLQARADPNVVHGKYGTALQAASHSGYLKIVQLLLQAKADPNIVNHKNITALQCATYQGHAQVVELLLQANADPNIIGEGMHATALQAASHAGYTEIVKVLLKAGADPNLIGGKYGSALQAAAYKGHQHIVELLLQTQADPNSFGGIFGTALQAAAQSRWGYPEIVQLLLEHRADPNVIGGHYGTALQAASERGCQDVIQILLDAGAQPSQQKSLRVLGVRYEEMVNVLEVNLESVREEDENEEDDIHDEHWSDDADEMSTSDESTSSYFSFEDN